MIHVELQPEPTTFDTLVRKPGNDFLTKHPNASPDDIEKHPYWRKVLDDLHDVYGGICAYSCHWISHDTGFTTVEHFLPKSKYRQQAYEWSNYRLVCGRLNSRKRVDENVLDPFVVETGWFVMAFPSLIIKPAEGLGTSLTEEIVHTINTLKLNDYRTCLKARSNYLNIYCSNQVTFQHLQKEAPFIAFELDRQGLRDEIKDIWQPPAPC